MAPFNLSATLNLYRVFTNPALALPHLTISTFDHLPIPLSPALRIGKEADIRAVILDKDNCFATPHALDVYPAYNSTFQRLREAYPGDRLLIVSNSAGTGDDNGHKEAAVLEKNTGVKVLLHSTKKPGCHHEIMEFLKASPDANVTSPDQVAIVGDRLFTDVLMANMMGSWGIWVKDGVVPARQRFFGRMEHWLADKLERNGRTPPIPGPVDSSKQ